MNARNIGRIGAGLALIFLLAPGLSADPPFPHLLSLRERVEAVNRVTEIRLEELLPRVMREAGIDMWLILTQEDNVDAVFRTMAPMNSWFRRDLIFVMYDRGPGQGVERMNVSRMNTRGLFDRAWDHGAGNETRWECLARIVRERDPQRIGINQSGVIWAADGLSATLKTRLVESLDKKYVDRLVSAERLCTLWLETLLEEDLELYERAVSVGHALIADTYSSRVVTPGVTTVDDLVYHYWQRAAELGLQVGFTPSFSIRGRSPEAQEKYGTNDRVIRRGDLLHCDVGIVYLRYHTDHQEWAYVLRPGEEDVPQIYKDIMAVGNRLQDIFCREFKTGLTGNEILNTILNAARAEGIPKPKVYSHSVGFYLHEPGPLIGLPEEQSNTGGRGDVKLVPNSTFTAELSTTCPIPGRDGQELRMALEQIVVFTGTGTRFLDGRQTRFHIIR